MYYKLRKTDGLMHINQTIWQVFANECRNVDKRAGKCKGNNLKFSENRRNKTVNLVSTKNIQPNEELYVPYGRDYQIII